MNEVTASTTPAKKLGIKESKEFLAFIIGIANGVGLSMADKKWEVEDAKHFVRPLMDAVPAFVGIGQVPKEAADYDDDERKELLTFVMDKFTLPQAKAEAAIERALNVMNNIFDVAHMFKDIFNEGKTDAEAKPA